MKRSFLLKMIPVFLFLLYAGSAVSLAADANATAFATPILVLPVPPTPGNISASMPSENLTAVPMDAMPGAVTPRPSPGSAFTFMPALLAIGLIALRKRN